MRKDIQWFPGHMAKARRMLLAHLGKVDVVIELLDARIPASSRNPDVDVLLASKPRVVVLNKSDLADEEATRDWESKLRGEGAKAVVPVDAVKGRGVPQVVEACRKAAAPRLAAEAAKGRRPRPVRLMVVGIPNVGKSSLINRLVSKPSAKVGNKPGVTKGPQWVRIRDDMELLDTPGLLWPKFDDQAVGLKLALTGAIATDVLDIDTVVEGALAFLQRCHPDALSKRYRDCDSLELAGEAPFGPVTDAQVDAVLRCIATSRGFLLPGGVPDLQKAAETLLKDMRDGLLGRFTLDAPR